MSPLSLREEVGTILLKFDLITTEDLLRSVEDEILAIITREQHYTESLRTGEYDRGFKNGMKAYKLAVQKIVPQAAPALALIYDEVFLENDMPLEEMKGLSEIIT